MRKTEAWWVCVTCQQPLIKVGKRGIDELILEHRKTCHELAGCCIKQVEQRKGGREA